MRSNWDRIIEQGKLYGLTDAYSKSDTNHLVKKYECKYCGSRIKWERYKQGKKKKWRALDFLTGSIHYPSCKKIREQSQELYEQYRQRITDGA